MKSINIKRSIAVIMTVMLFVGTVLGEELSKGKYSIKNIVSHDNQVGQGMARSYTEEESELEVTSDGINCILGFNNTQYMGDFTIQVNGSVVNYQVVSHNTTTNIKKLKFKIPNINAVITVGLYVVPMDTQVDYRVTLDKSTLNLIEKEEKEEKKEKEEKDTAQSTAKVEESGKGKQTASSAANIANLKESASTSKDSDKDKPADLLVVDASKMQESASELTESDGPKSTDSSIESVSKLEKPISESELADDDEVEKDVATDKNPEQEIALVEDNKTLVQMKRLVIALFILLSAGGYYWYKKRKESRV